MIAVNTDPAAPTKTGDLYVLHLKDGGRICGFLVSETKHYVRLGMTDEAEVQPQHEVLIPKDLIALVQHVDAMIGSYPGGLRPEIPGHVVENGRPLPWVSKVEGAPPYDHFPIYQEETVTASEDSVGAVLSEAEDAMSLLADVARKGYLEAQISYRAEATTSDAQWEVSLLRRHATTEPLYRIARGPTLEATLRFAAQQVDEE